MISKITGVENQARVQKLSLNGAKVKSSSVSGSQIPQLCELPLGNIYGTKINFSGRVKKVKETLPEINLSPANAILKAENGTGEVSVDNWTKEHLYYGVGRGDKKWVGGENPKHLLKRSTADAINSIMTLVYGDNPPKSIPENIQTPNYGNSWGRHANYIEVNNRAIAKMYGDRTNSGIMSAIKLLPAIPPSHDKWANCVLISQLYPNIWGDGYNNNGENSLYGIKLEYERLSDNIGHKKIGEKWFTPEEQVKAFNDLAHLRGLKTSFRMLISEDQLKLGDSGQFRWSDPNHVEAFIIACCKGIELGFDGIFFDSAKHVGGYDWGNYAGVGATPDYDQMAYILAEIRKRTGRDDLSFSGEKAEGDTLRYKNMGLTAGTSGIDARNVEAVKNSAYQQKWCPEFAFGPTVSDDNDTGAMNYEERKARINGALFGYTSYEDKLPSFMQLHDLYPLNWGTNTHDLMLENRNFSSDGTPESHFDNLFADSETDVDYRRKVGEKFAHAYAYNQG